MSKPDTLMILSPGFPKDEADSACLPPQQVFVKNLQRQYPNLKIVVLAFQYPYYRDEYLWNDVQVIAFGGSNKAGMSRFMTWTRAMLKLRKIRRSHRLIGVLSFWTGECTLIASKFARKNRLKYYAWILGQDAKKGNPYVARTKPDPENIIAISDFVAKEFYRNYQIQPVHTIPIGIDPAQFHQVPAQKDIDLLGAGSLIRLKQYDVLINLVKALRESNPGIRAIIAGKGIERELLQKMITENKLEENIKLTGELPHTEVLNLMTRSKIFVHPSNYEGFSTVCLEALYAGTQVVSFVKPMQANIPNWHIADSPEEMLIVVKSLLQNPPANPAPVAPYLAKDSARAVMKLFNYNDPAIS